MLSLQNYFFLILLCNFVHHIQTRITIINPPSLANIFPNPIPASFSTFGKIYNGYNIRGKVLLPPNTSFNENYACNPLQPLSLQMATPELDSYPIILLDKGNCSYTQITRNVQNAHGYIALIINNVPGNPKSFSVTDDDTTDSDNILIPAILISKEDGNAIKQYILSNPTEKVQIHIEVSIQRSEIVTIDLYTDVIEQTSYILLKEFYSYYQLLEKYIIFNPMYISYQQTFNNETEMKQNCVSNGKYCFNLNLPNTTTSMNGKELLIESLFHQCLYKTNREKFFAYSNYYYNNCLLKSNDLHCGKDITQYDDVMRCVNSSFVIENDYESDNTIFNNNINMLTQNKILITPTIEVNKRKMKGRLTGMNLFYNICASFISAPKCCRELFWKVPERNMNYTFILTVISVVVVLNICIVLICKKYVFDSVKAKTSTADFDLDGRINMVVSSYFALKDVNKKDMANEPKQMIQMSETI